MHIPSFLKAHDGLLITSIENTAAAFPFGNRRGAWSEYMAPRNIYRLAHPAEAILRIPISGCRIIKEFSKRLFESSSNFTPAGCQIAWLQLGAWGLSGRWLAHRSRGRNPPVLEYSKSVFWRIVLFDYPSSYFPKEAMRHGYSKSMFHLVTCMNPRVLLSDSNVHFLPISNLDIWHKCVAKSFPGVHKSSV